MITYTSNEKEALHDDKKRKTHTRTGKIIIWNSSITSCSCRRNRDRVSDTRTDNTLPGTRKRQVCRWAATGKMRGKVSRPASDPYLVALGFVRLIEVAEELIEHIAQTLARFLQRMNDDRDEVHRQTESKSHRTPLSMSVSYRMAAISSYSFADVKRDHSSDWSSFLSDGP